MISVTRVKKTEQTIASTPSKAVTTFKGVDLCVLLS